MSDPRIVLFQRCLGVTFRDSRLLELVLGFRRGNDTEPGHGSMAKLGDVVLELSAQTESYRLHLQYSKQMMNRWKDQAVSNAALAQTAHRLGLIPWFHRHEEPRFPTHAYGSLMEIVLAAIYLDRGFARAHRFLRRWHYPHIPIPER